MTYKGRALYNLIKMNFNHDPHLEVESWQIEDYRNFSIEELFKRLEEHQIYLDKDHFLLYVEEADSPEELADFLCVEEDYIKHEKVFLLVFELWRRLSPLKQVLSILCDELDHLIEAYEEGRQNNDEELQKQLLNTQRILEDYVDKGGDPLEGFKLISEYSCHNLELFIYEYIAHQIDIENDLYASEFVDGFYPYIKNKYWFDFLRIRLVSAVDPEEGNIMLDRLLESLTERSDLPLLYEILNFLIYIGNKEQLLSTFNTVFRFLEVEDDLRELLSVVLDYFSYNKKIKEEKVIITLLEQRKEKSPEEKLNSQDSTLHLIKELIATD